MKAVKIVSKGVAEVVGDAAVPKLRGPDWVLVKTVAIALNPTDWKNIDDTESSTPPTLGCDFAGLIEEVGPAVVRPWKKGDRVWGFVLGSNNLHPEGGAFGEYIVTKGGLIAKIPDNVSFESAATAGVATVTVGQGLYQEMLLPWPDSPLTEKLPILIAGGSASTGAIGIQFAKLSGFEVLTTCSPRNFEYVKTLGADEVFDSRNPEIGREIRKFTNDKLYYAWDCIGEHNSPQICADALASTAPKDLKLHYGTVLATDVAPRKGVVLSTSVGYSAQGEDWEYRNKTIPGRPDHFEFMTRWLPTVEKLFEEGKWKPHHAEVRDGGFQGVLNGLRDMKEGKVSGVKLVYRVGEP